MATVSVVVVAYNALPWLEQALESVAGHEVVVVDHGSTDESVEVARRHGARVIEQGNLGFGAGNNAGMRAASGDYTLLLNADAWVVGDAVERLAGFLDEHPEVGMVGPRLLDPDGTLQRSARAFPTIWRLATEYYGIRKLAPGTDLLNPLYLGSFDHATVREVDWLSGACLLVRREAVEAVGPFDESFFMFSEETDWCYRFRAAGWKVVFAPVGDVVHVGGASHGGRLQRENLRGSLRFLAKHRGLREAERARRVLLLALRLRGLVLRGERGRKYRDGAEFLASGSAQALLS